MVVSTPENTGVNPSLYLNYSRFAVHLAGSWSYKLETGSGKLSAGSLRLNHRSRADTQDLGMNSCSYRLTA